MNVLDLLTLERPNLLSIDILVGLKYKLCIGRFGIQSFSISINFSGANPIKLSSGLKSFLIIFHAEAQSPLKIVFYCEHLSYWVLLVKKQKPNYKIINNFSSNASPFSMVAKYYQPRLVCIHFV